MALDILKVDRCRSTNDIAFERLNHHHRACVWSTHQTQGRGSRGRTWITPKDAGLALSIGLTGSEYPIPRDFPYPLFAGVVVIQALSIFVKRALKLKWPNDVLCEGLKLCGILCESKWQRSKSRIVVGLGINLRPHPDIAAHNQRYVSLAEINGTVPDPIALVNAIVPVFFDCMWRYQDAELLHRHWLSNSDISLGSPIRVKANEQHIDGRFSGLDRQGHFLIETDNGHLHSIKNSCTDFAILT